MSGSVLCENSPLSALNFEWDSRKAARNLAKHGVPFEEAATVFGDPLGRIADDPRENTSKNR